MTILMTVYRTGQRGRHFTVALLLAMLLSLGATVLNPLSAPAQVGPPAPKEKKVAPAGGKMDALKDKFGKMFLPQEGEEEPEEEYEEVKRGAGMPGQFDTVKRKKKRAPVPQRKGLSKTGRPPLLSQPKLSNPKVDKAEVSGDNPPQSLPSMDDPKNPLGIADAQKKLNETASLIDKKQIYTAKARLIPLKEWLIESTEAHIGLYKALNNVSSARVQAELEKQVALEFAKMRDKAFYQMGRIHIAEHENREAIKMLIEVIKSQPRGELGLKSYELLQKMGFTQKIQLVE